MSIAEVGRAVRRIDPEFDEAALNTVSLHRVASGCRRAARLQPAGLRALDAIHLATALSHGDGDVQMITYDERLAAAARAHGLRVVQPGR